MNQGLAVILPMLFFTILDFVIVLNVYKYKYRASTRTIFLFMTMASFVQQLCGMISYLFDYKMWPAPAIVQYVVYLFLFTAMAITSFEWYMYLRMLLSGKQDIQKSIKILFAIPIAVIFGMTIVSPWTHWIFWIGPDGVYQRGTLYFLQFLCTYIYVVFAIVALISYRKRRKSAFCRKVYSSFIMFILPAILGTAFQLKVFPGGYTMIGISLAVLFMYLNLYIDEVNESKRIQLMAEEQTQHLKKVTELNQSLEKQMEEISALNSELKQARDQAEAANIAKTTFLFNMSHDIRTPMNAIMGFTDLTMKHYDDREKCMDYLHKTQEANKFLLSLINSVLEMARIESGKEQLDETVCHTGVVTREIISIFEEQMRQKNITFTSNVNIQTPYMLCDQPKLREICLNILSNAVKYTPEGGNIFVEMLELPCERPGYARIRGVCADTGIGMSKEFLPHLFEEFAREQTSTRSQQQGTGLGMPIVKRLIDLMGGTIEVESELGKGSTFIVTIDLKIMDTAPEEKPESKDVEVQVDFTGKRILLAEDNDLNAEIAMEILSDVGIEVERAADGIICVDMLQKAPEHYYDIILMDIQMPNMDGYKATKIIRSMKDSCRSQIPIVAMTANAFDADKKNALEAGMNGHLAKPIEIEKLFATLADLT